MVSLLCKFSHLRGFQKLLPLKFEIFKFYRLIILRENKLDLKSDFYFRNLRSKTILRIQNLIL